MIELGKVQRMVGAGIESDRASIIARGFVGEMRFGLWVAANLPTGWLLANGSTIGNVSSGGTARADNDTFDLFELLWDNTTNSELTIQTSGGAGSTRGASALADFRANKRLPLPDMRGKHPLGLAAAGTGSTLGGTGGTIDLTAAAHYHGMGTGADLNITSSGGNSGSESSHTHAISAVKYNTDAVHSHQGQAGYLAEAADDSVGAANASATDGGSGHLHDINHTHASGNFAGSIGLVTGGEDGNGAITVGNAPFLAGNWMIAY
jgi:hypothetical protein